MQVEWSERWGPQSQTGGLQITQSKLLLLHVTSAKTSEDRAADQA